MINCRKLLPINVRHLGGGIFGDFASVVRPIRRHNHGVSVNIPTAPQGSWFGHWSSMRLMLFTTIQQMATLQLSTKIISIDPQLNCSISDCIYWVTNEKTDCAWGLVIWHILMTRVNIWLSVCRSTRVDHQRRDIWCILTSKKQQQQENNYKLL